MECECSLNYNDNGVFGTPNIEKCPLCKAAPALLAACEGITKNRAKAGYTQIIQKEWDALQTAIQAAGRKE